MLEILEDICKKLSYDADTGIFTWFISPARNVKAGSVAGSPSSDGYIKILWKKKTYRAHRLAWAFHYNEEPPLIIDHINGDKLDNRVSNLRSCDKSQNQANSKHTKSLCGIKGLTQLENGKFQVQIRVRGRSKYVGTFDDRDVAASAYKSAHISAFGDFSPYNKSTEVV